eukprot:TRINITY_DN558_c0_g4_i2.p2 TRINITY_DN558_c0_g4~~TRINITY_DN558_c0_g4_i2.p2  ORF type:complete len:203 (+),score=40.36 TRINITY_DN558_c0_g4_i2:243-851(+)
MGVKRLQAEETKGNPKIIAGVGIEMDKNAKVSARTTASKLNTDKRSSIKSPTLLNSTKGKQEGLNKNYVSNGKEKVKSKGKEAVEKSERPKTAASRTMNRTAVKTTTSKFKATIPAKQSKAPKVQGKKVATKDNKTDPKPEKDEKESQEDEVVTEEDLKVYESLLKSGFTLGQILASKEHCGFDLDKITTCLQTHRTISTSK